MINLVLFEIYQKEMEFRIIFWRKVVFLCLENLMHQFLIGCTYSKTINKRSHLIYY